MTSKISVGYASQVYMKVEMSGHANPLEGSLPERFGLWKLGFEAYRVQAQIPDSTHFSKLFSDFMFAPSFQVHLGLTWKYIWTLHSKDRTKFAPLSKIGCLIFFSVSEDGTEGGRTAEVAVYAEKSLQIREGRRQNTFYSVSPYQWCKYWSVDLGGRRVVGGHHPLHLLQCINLNWSYRKESQKVHRFIKDE